MLLTSFYTTFGCGVLGQLFVHRDGLGHNMIITASYLDLIQIKSPFNKRKSSLLYVSTYLLVSIWKERNKRPFNGKYFHPLDQNFILLVLYEVLQLALKFLFLV